MNLTIDEIYRAYDRVWDHPEETHWYLCHPDDLDRLRATFAPERWGTCPLIKAHSMAQAGKVLKIAHNVDERWQWPWQRKGGR